MSQEAFIGNLTRKNSDYNNPELAITTANLCNTISKDINTDSQRFIYELLQNADDASNQNPTLEVRIDFIGDFLIVSHKGEPFSEIDIESISSAGDGTKTGDTDKIGFKGIGFKSVFSHSDYVIIKSSGYCFRYDRKAWDNYWSNTWGEKAVWQAERRRKQKEDLPKMPWHVIPLWTTLPSELQQLNFLEEYTVSTIIKYKNIDKLKEDLSALFSDTQIVLFLRSKEVKINVKNGIENVVIEKIHDRQTNSILLQRNKIVQSEWITKTFQFDIPVNVRNEINADEKAPKKLKEALKTEISFAIQLEKGRMKAADKANRLIFTYLPTSINYDFPFLVNANFLTDAGRQHLHRDIFWNNWLFKQIPLKLFTWVSELAEYTSKYKKQILSIIPHKLNGANSLEASFNEGYKQALQTIAFIPNTDKQLLKVGDAIFDKTGISNFISTELLIKFVNDESRGNFSIHSFVERIEPISTLSRLGVKMFEVEDLGKFFTSNVFIDEHCIEENFQLISFLYQQSQAFRDEDAHNWDETIRRTPFIFDEELKLRSPKHIYFPSKRFSSDFATSVSVIHSDIVEDIENNPSIKNWLEQLGVREPSDLSFIEKTIIEQASSYVTTINAIEVTRFLFNAHKKAILQSYHYDGLQQLPLLTKKGTLVAAGSSFLSNFYEPSLKLENSYNENFYVTEGYQQHKDLTSEWKTFFLKIGVKENRLVAVL